MNVVALRTFCSAAVAGPKPSALGRPAGPMGPLPALAERACIDFE